MIEISRLQKSYQGKAILKGIDLQVGRGEVVVVIGPSGSGKTTLLRCINGLEPFSSGTIQIGSLELTPGTFKEAAVTKVLQSVRRKVGMVFQQFQLFPHLTALENIILAPLKVLRMERAQAEARARTLLQRINLAGKEHCYPGTLSGGEQQRVAIARALAMEPDALLLDEPTSSLDPELVGEVLSVISDLASQKYTMMIVTHQIGFARSCASRVLFLDDGEIIEQGSPLEVLEAPQSERAKNFLRHFGQSARLTG